MQQKSGNKVLTPRKSVSSSNGNLLNVKSAMEENPQLLPKKKLILKVKEPPTNELQSKPTENRNLTSKGLHSSEKPKLLNQNDSFVSSHKSPVRAYQKSTSEPILQTENTEESESLDYLNNELDKLLNKYIDQAKNGSVK
ncbi:MAG: hypothetical protein A4E71_01756 [Smithella sp. PtaU1.Bin162]|nr:MAG: hypothetical protein A4E71_01756 [Smithella sp. PtaU1.Bin162]